MRLVMVNRRDNSFAQSAPMSSLKVALPSPASVEEFDTLECLNDGGDKCVSRFVPGILIKFSWHQEAEVHVLQFIHGWLSVRMPCVSHHVPFPNTFLEPWDWQKGVWYFFMDECPDVRLDTVIHCMSPTELDHIDDQLRILLKEMCSCTSTMPGSITSGPYDNRFMPHPWQPPHTFPSTTEYLTYYREIFLEFCGPEYGDEMFGCFPNGPNVLIHLTHSDLLPCNILVNGSTITGVIDWETTGFYPEFWECCQMHNLEWMTPEWACILARVSPGPHREREITAVSQIIRDLHYNNSVFC
ncbi:hypothetical protein WOLCODRAFT_140248 [Wolfiporia cocos MD-104 SS10]|uniref:Aminoglycoside phosphotransferase domain-containing protein n=1 Tax=Wolfiporia cocos (strain MD-104) TaxID=742152 RepID=A0A2H3JES5_WOLCO|nr:hypothetical protein WOLCODRAFT_140248 [Wolfiporia cocos MD-104 SS10]